MNIETKMALLDMGDAFRQFSRNGRWGTCGACPRDIQGNAYPEHCEHTYRHDHQMTAQNLAGQWDNRIRLRKQNDKDLARELAAQDSDNSNDFNG